MKSENWLVLEYKTRRSKNNYLIEDGENYVNTYEVIETRFIEKSIAFMDELIDAYMANDSLPVRLFYYYKEDSYEFVNYEDILAALKNLKPISFYNNKKLEFRKGSIVQNIFDAEYTEENFVQLIDKYEYENFGYEPGYYEEKAIIN